MIIKKDHSQLESGPHKLLSWITIFFAEVHMYCVLVGRPVALQTLLTCSAFDELSDHCRRRQRKQRKQQQGDEAETLVGCKLLDQFKHETGSDGGQ